MRDRVVLDSGVISALYFEENASERDLADLAYEIALENETTFYDSLFLAAAAREEVTLLTLDKKLYEKVRATANIQMI